MGVELKTVNPVVFDDPDYCQNESSKCKFLTRITDSRFCGLFSTEDKTVNLKIDSYGYALKCQECKDHYQKAIEVEKIETDHRTQHQKQMDKHFIGH